MSQLLNDTNKANQLYDIYCNEVNANILTIDAIAGDLVTANDLTVTADAIINRIETTQGIKFSSGIPDDVFLNNYQVGQFNATFSGAFDDTVTVHYLKLGKLAILQFPDVISTVVAVSADIEIEGLPEHLYPFTRVDLACFGRDNGLDLPAASNFRIDIDGQISLYKQNNDPNYTNGALGGMYGCAFTYISV